MASVLNKTAIQLQDIVERISYEVHCFEINCNYLFYTYLGENQSAINLKNEIIKYFACSINTMTAVIQ